jgi:hypothetical protein
MVRQLTVRVWGGCMSTRTRIENLRRKKEYRYDREKEITGTKGTHTKSVAREEEHEFIPSSKKIFF